MHARLAEDAGASPPVADAQALSALIAGDDARAGERAAAMRSPGGTPPPSPRRRRGVAVEVRSPLFPQPAGEP